MRAILTFSKHFAQGWKLAGERILCRSFVKQDKKMRANMSEKSLDHMLADTFPASDPVTMY